MVKIVQISDSHLGYRTRRGVINKWAIQNYSKPYEQEIYDLFLKVMTDISLIKNLDFVVHCGDMFHHPSKYIKSLSFMLKGITGSSEDMNIHHLNHTFKSKDIQIFIIINKETY